MLEAEEAVEIRVLRRQGKSIRAISRMLGPSRNTVRRYLRTEGLPRYQRESQPSKLDPYKSYLAERVKAAMPEWIPATVLLREIRAQGYLGGYSILKEHLATLQASGEIGSLIRFDTEPGLIRELAPTIEDLRTEALRQFACLINLVTRVGVESDVMQPHLINLEWMLDNRQSITHRMVAHVIQ